MSGANREVAGNFALKLEAIKSAVKASNGDTAIAAFAPTPTPIEKGVRRESNSLSRHSMVVPRNEAESTPFSKRIRLITAYFCELPAGAAADNGRSTVTVVSSPSTEVSRSWPSWSSTICLTMANPRPVPGITWSVALLAR